MFTQWLWNEQKVAYNLYKQDHAQIDLADSPRPDLRQCFCCNFKDLGLFASHVNANPKNTILPCYSFFALENNDFCGFLNPNFVFSRTFIRSTAKDILFTLCQLVKENLSGPGSCLVDSLNSVFVFWYLSDLFPPTQLNYLFVFWYLSILQTKAKDTGGKSGSCCLAERFTRHCGVSFLLIWIFYRIFLTKLLHLISAIFMNCP